MRSIREFIRISSRHATLLEFLLYAVLTAIMLHATWLTWPDAFIDFSRELYLPWRVSCGDILYRDLAYDFGPVSVYTNAALFALLGRPSIHALFALNFAFWIATLLALRALLRRSASPLAATLAVSSFILLFSFNRYLLVGNYNFLAPYSHEITRGFLFALLSILACDSAFRSFPAPRFSTRFLLAGAVYSIVLFTKPELALASSAALALLFVLHAFRCRTALLRHLFTFSLAVVLTGALIILPFALAFHSLPQALHDTLLKHHLDCLNLELTALPFYRDILGIDQPLPNAFRILLGTFLVVLPFLLSRLALPRISSRAHRISAATLLAAIAATIGWFAFFPLNAALSLAPAALLACCLLPWQRRCACIGAEGDFSNRFRLSSSPPLAAAFALFSLILVSKMFLNAHIWHYGFVLALPAFCCSLLLAFRPSCHSRDIAIIAVALLLAFLAKGLRENAATLHNFAIHAPVFDGSFRTASFQAEAFNSALAWLRANTPRDSTLAVLPEGSLLNLQSRRSNSTPFVYLSPGDLLRFSDSAVLDAYSNAPPDTLVLVTKLGEPRFGIDYAQNLMGFLNPLYTPVFTIPLSTPAGTIPYLVIARKTDSLSPPDFQECPPP